MQEAIKQVLAQSARQIGIASEPRKTRDNSPKAVAARKAAIDQAIASADRCVISAVNAHKTANVLRTRHGPAVERF